MGLNNYRYFLAFLYLHALICTYGLWVGYEIMMSIVDKERLLEVQFQNSSGEIITATPWIVFSFLQQEHQWFIGVLILCAVIAVMLWLFVGWHFYLVSKGLTTNEWSKSSYYLSYLRSSEEVFAEWVALKEEDETAMPPDEIVEEFRLDKAMPLKQIKGML